MRSRLRRRHNGYEPPELIVRADYSIVAFVAVLAVSLCWWAEMRVPTHAVMLDLPADPFQPWPEGMPVHRLTVTRTGTIHWNDELVSQAMLVERLQAVAMKRDSAGLVFEPEAYASYEHVAYILNLVAATGAGSGHFCLGGLRQHALTPDEAHGAETYLPLDPTAERRSGQTRTEPLSNCEIVSG